MAVEENDRSFFKSLLQLPFFQEAGLDEVALTPEEEAEIEQEAKSMLLHYFLSLPAFRETSREEGSDGL